MKNINKILYLVGVFSIVNILIWLYKNNFQNNEPIRWYVSGGFEKMSSDDIQDDKYLFPSLTTMSQDIRLKGQLAAKTIIENIDNSNNSFSMVNLGAKLVERDTVKKLN